MQKLILVLLFSLLFSENCKSQSNTDSRFVGLWVNSQYELFKDSSNENLLYAISPQLIKVDSSGNCTLYLRYEQKSKVGKPIKVRSFGAIMEMTYKKNYTFSLSLIAGEKDMIVLTFPANPSSILFIRKKTP